MFKNKIELTSNYINSNSIDYSSQTACFGTLIDMMKINILIVDQPMSNLKDVKSKQQKTTK